MSEPPKGRAVDQPTTGGANTKAMSDRARASYERCCAEPDFIPAFYRNFFAVCPEARPRFAHTDFRRQHNLLRHALSLLLLFPTKPDPEARNLLRRVAERHGRNDLAIDPSLYAPFVDSLVTTVGQYDPDYSAEIEAAWRGTVAKGVDYMISKY